MAESEHHSLGRDGSQQTLRFGVSDILSEAVRIIAYLKLIPGPFLFKFLLPLLILRCTWNEILFDKVWNATYLKPFLKFSRFPRFTFELF